MLITEDILEQGMSRNGGWSAKQLRILGVTNDLFIKGWKTKLVGSEVSEGNIKRFLALKDSHLEAVPLLI